MDKSFWLRVVACLGIGALLMFLVSTLLQAMGASTEVSYWSGFVVLLLAFPLMDNDARFDPRIWPPRLLAAWTIGVVGIIAFIWWIFDNSSLAGWIALICLLIAGWVMTKEICQHTNWCRGLHNWWKTKAWPGIKKSFRFMKVHMKRTGRHIARWWRDDAKPWLSAARTRVYTWFTTTALPWLGRAFKWFFGLLWEHKWAILAIGGAYLTYELYNPRKGEWYQFWKWGKQSWWWITSITVATVATLVWLPAFREKLFELAGEGLAIAAKAYRTHYNGITGGWKALYWLSLLGTPVATWWLWNNYYRKDLWILAVVGVVCFFIAHFGQDGDKAAKKVVDAWEGAKTAKR